MKSHATPDFWRQFYALPAGVRKQTRDAYRLWRDDPRYPGLHFKRIQASDPPLYSVRIGLRWRALAVRQGDDLIWF